MDTRQWGDENVLCLDFVNGCTTEFLLSMGEFYILIKMLHMSFINVLIFKGSYLLIKEKLILQFFFQFY